MNVFELITILSIIYAGYYCSNLFGNWHEPFGRIIGFLLGCLLTIIVYIALRFVIHVGNRRPKCKTGKCSHKDYKLVGIGKNNNLIFICSCGIKYSQDKYRFSEILEDGTTRPYLYRKGIIFKKWIADDVRVAVS